MAALVKRSPMDHPPRSPRPPLGALRSPLIAISLALLALPWFAGRTASPGEPPDPVARHHALRALGAMPLWFEPNQGQAPPGVDYVSRAPGYQLSVSGRAA